MFNRLPYLSGLLCTFILITGLHAQHKDNPFSKQKGKKSGNTSIVPKQTIDGRLSKKNIFSSSPLFSVSDPHHKAIYSPGSSAPVWIESSSFENTESLPVYDREVQLKSFQYLAEISRLTKITEPQKELKVKSINIQKNGTHIKFQQHYLTIPIKGSELIVHFLENKKLVNGRYIPTPHLAPTVPSISENTAASTAISDLKSEGKFRTLTEFEKNLLDYSEPVTKLIYYQPDLNDTRVILSWETEVRPNPLDHYEYIIDALTGQILHKQNHTCSANPAVSTATDLNGVSQTFGTWENGSTFYMIDISKPMYSATLSSMPDNPAGAIWTIDAGNTDLTNFTQITSSSINSWNSKAVSAHSNADSCYNYYINVHSRNSLNGSGGTIISVINVTDNGQPMDNAYWNGRFMAYGNGDVLFKPLAGGLDVAAHEMTHGVIQNSANLNYQGQSGAINESLADIFGCMVDRDDWHIGEDIMAASSAPYFPSGYLRDLSNPHNGGTTGSSAWQPMHMNEYVATTSDNGGVHINSGIPNYAYYLFATSVTLNVAEDVYYYALTNYLTASSQFIDLRLAIIQSANQLFPSDQSIADAAANAFDQVGIIDGTGSTPTGNLPVNPGTDYLLALGTTQTTKTLYKINPNNSTITGISTTAIDNKPSVTDDGSFAYFVDINGNIIQKDLNTNSELLFDNSDVWDNVAVSKDGSMLAAVTNQTDSSIYVRKVSESSWTRFKLYNPTYSGISTDGPQYADAIEWDYSGENLVYDCYNLTVNSSNDTIDYWSIGFINVWDKLNDTYASGSIKNLFDGLPSYINIGNPTFAKNSKDVIAFDLIDLSYFEFYLMGTNIETGNTGYILDIDMGTLGYPTYSRLDNKVAFTALDNLYDTTIFTIGLSADKINYDPLSSINSITSYRKIPVWYATGARVLGTQKAVSETELHAYPNPFSEEINLELNLKNGGRLNIELINSLGQTVKTLYSGDETTGDHSYHFSLGDTENGTYYIKVRTPQEAGIIKLIKVK